MADTIAIASDHAGFPLKSILMAKIIEMGFEIEDLGANNEESVDYPDFGKKCADYVAKGSAKFGVVICGSGVGISIAANRNPKIRAALCHNEYTAEMSRKHNDANILAIGSRVVDENTALRCLEVFLNTDFEGGRHKTRVDKL